jgi:uncharacterized protein with GYD domain
MPKYALFFTFRGETVKSLMSNPGDRAATVRDLCKSAGGELESYYLMFGERDGFVVVDLPDSRSAAAVSLAVSSSNAFAKVDTHELIDVADLNGILATASQLAYSPPGA